MQATYTAREQRVGVWILAFLVTGLFDHGRLRPTPPAPPAAGRSPQQPTTASPPGIGPSPQEPTTAASPQIACSASNGVQPLTAGALVVDAVADETSDLNPAPSLLRNLWRGGNDGEDTPFEDASDTHAGGSADNTAQADVEAVRKNARFHWKACKEAFPNTPPHAAATYLFAEHVLLVGCITRHLGSAVGASSAAAWEQYQRGQNNQ